MRTRLVLLPLLSTWTVASGRSFAAETWLSIQTPHFTVVSNAGEGTARKTAAEFEEVRAAYAMVWPGGRMPPAKPAVVLALRNESSLRRFAPGYFEVKGGIDVVSGTAEGRDRQYLLLRTDARPIDRQVTPNYNLYRAYVLALLRSSFERPLPPWLLTGLGEVLGNTSVGDGEIHVGRPVPWHFARFNRGARLPLQAILDARHESPLLLKEAQRPQFDAQCYVLLHYLLYGDRGIHAPRLALFMRLWMEGRSQDQAWAESLGSIAAVEAALPGYATRPVLSYARFKAESRPPADRPPVSMLAPAEVEGLLALVHVAMGRPVDAQAALRVARTADPRSPASYDAEGQLADRDGDAATATQAYARAVELGSASAYSHYRAAQLAWKDGADAATLARIRALLERSLALNPSYASASSYLAEVMVDQGDTTAALAAAQRAVSLEPGASYPRVALARVFHALGRADEAARAIEDGFALADGDAERSRAERFKLYLAQVSRFEREREDREAAQKRAADCQAGSAEACRALLPELQRLCAEKQAGACSYLAWLHQQGQGVPKDAARAMEYAGRACEAGDKRACVERAWAAAEGEGVPKDEAGAEAALEPLCDEGFLPACTRLALLHARRPEPARRERARELLGRACQGGEADACSMATQIP